MMLISFSVAVRCSPLIMAHTTVNCPHCGKIVQWHTKEVWKPFCSERCKLVDLGDWIAENHRIADTPIETHSTDDEYNSPDYH